jgi:glycosyltransferase involved in cell wall biosynthesis
MSVRVCVMTSVHPPFDVRIFHKECKSLAREGYEVTLIAPGTHSGTVNGVRLEAIPKARNRFDRMVRGSLEVYKKARREDADIYHFHDPELIPIALLLRLSGKHVIYDAHEDLPRTFTYKSYIPRFLRSLVARFAGIIEESSSRVFSAVVVANPVTADRFRAIHRHAVVVHNYPKIEELREAHVPDGRNKSGDGAFLYVGMRITRPRGAEEMIRAVGMLPPELKARLKLVGAWDPPDLPRRLSSLPGWERTEYLGTLGRPAVARVLREARAGLCLLHPEPNYLTAEPVKIFEYMCSGIPVITGDFPSCRDIIETVGCGLLVDPLDPEEIAWAMEYLHSNPEEANAMGQRGLEAVQSEYNWRREENVLLDLYRNLLDPRGSARTQPVTLRGAR